MLDRSPFPGAGPSSKEEEYFRKKDAELIEKMLQQGRSEGERKQLAEAAEVTDPQILQDLQTLGYTKDTVRLLHVVPLLCVAWADGSVSRREAESIREAARARGVEQGSPAYRLLQQWLHQPPSDEFVRKSLQAIRAILELSPPQARQAGTRNLVSLCKRVASASAGFPGFGSKISGKELRLIKRIIAELHG